MTKQSLFDLTDLGLVDDDLVQESIVQSVIAAAGGILTGRIRLQKFVFLLDKLGLNSGFEYTYHHYGPYASNLTDAVDFAKAFNILSEEFDHRKSDGARYSIYKIGSHPICKSKNEFLSKKNVEHAISAMNSVSSTILELAATACWLKQDENLTDWRDEIVKRKGKKTDDGRLEKAEALLADIGLNLN